MKELKFHPSYVKDIAEGRKTKTFRYQDEKNLSHSDEVVFKTPDGKPFAEAVIGRTVEQQLRHFNSPSYFDGHTSADDVETLMKGMNNYYDDHIYEDSLVKLICFEVKHIVGPHPELPSETELALTSAPATETGDTDKEVHAKEVDVSEIENYTFWQLLQENGEVEVKTDNDVVYELHLDAEYNEDTGEVEFVDGDGQRHSFDPDDVMNKKTHPSHVVEGF